MVRVGVEESKDHKITEQNFLSSVDEWHKENGVKLAVQRVSGIYDLKEYDSQKIIEDQKGISVTCAILDDMDKCWATALDENEKPLKVKEKGKLVNKIETIENPKEVTFFLKVGVVEDNPDEYSANTLSKAYSLFNLAFIEAEEVEPTNKGPLFFTHDELKEVLMSMEFRAFAEERNYKTTFYVLSAKSAIEVEIIK